MTDRQDRARYLRTNAYEFTLAAAAVVVAAVFLLNGKALERTALGQNAGALGDAWNILYAAGGVSVVAGMLGITSRWGWRLELAGLFLLGAAYAANGLTVLITRGAVGFGTSALYLALACATAMRVRMIVRLADEQQVDGGIV